MNKFDLLLQSSSERHIETVSEFVAWIEDVQDAMKGPLLFRGIGNKSYQLSPQALRDLGKGGATEVFAKARERFEAFKDLAPSRYDCPPGVSSDGHWVTLGQHHGLPTLLLDWTRNSLAALWFACVKQNSRQDLLNLSTWNDVNRFLSKKGAVQLKTRFQQLRPDGDCDAAVWAISPVAMNAPIRDGTADPLQPLDDAIVKFAYRSDDSWSDVANDRAEYHGQLPSRPDEWRSALGAVAVRAHESVARAMAQQGAFTIHLHESPIDEALRSSMSGIRCVIRGRCKRRIVNQLLGLGVERRTLFPDIANLALHLAAR